MSAIYLASAGIPRWYSAIPGWEALAACDERCNHRLVDEPDAADVVLFTECHQLGKDWRLDTIRNTPIARRFRDRVYVYDQRDRPWCAFPGLYVSMPARAFAPRAQRAWSYMPPSEPHTVLGLTERPDVDPDLLVSFVGAPTHPVRQSLFAIDHPRALVERVDGFMFHDASSHDYEGRRRRFAETMFRSKFVLCPRGHGTSSIRLFETLAAGRVPVVISDDWVAPKGPTWDACSVRWSEAASTESLLAYLEELEPRAGEMGAAARDAFTTWFAESVVFDRAAEQLTALVEPRATAGFPRRGRRDRAYRRLMVAESAGRWRHSLKHRSRPR